MTIRHLPRRRPSVLPVAALALAALGASFPLARAQSGYGQNFGTRPSAEDRQPAQDKPHRGKHDKDVVPAIVPLTTGGTPQSQIVTIVNGDVISQADVDARRRLFAMSTGLPLTPDVLHHLSSQVSRELIDEKLRLQEIQRRKIVVTDQDIANAITEIETRNRMQPGALFGRMVAAGIPTRTLVDQLRVQIGWTRVLREALGDSARVTPQDITAQQAILKSQTGQPQYSIGEIFIPADDPSHQKDAEAFADTVITQLHNGAPFAVVAAQFSQSQTALQGGDVGWQQTDQMEPEVAKVVTQMPDGAVSNPIPVAGGYMIVSLRGRRQIGNDLQTVADIREAFFPFTTPLVPTAPTAQQQQTLLRAKALSATATSCDAVEKANEAAGKIRPSNPGPIRLAEVTPPAFQAVLTTIPIGKASPPLVSQEGIVIIAVCARDQRNMAAETPEQIAERLVNERADLISRQLERDLHRRAVIDQRPVAD